ncbi:MAG: hypothetical protein HQ538_02945 [Parcubacteria group bacterium]|nr:hypothetical protein [Parcubacteria group bacterium]
MDLNDIFSGKLSSEERRRFAGEEEKAPDEFDGMTHKELIKYYRRNRKNLGVGVIKKGQLQDESTLRDLIREAKVKKEEEERDQASDDIEILLDKEDCQEYVDDEELGIVIKDDDSLEEAHEKIRAELARIGEEKKESDKDHLADMDFDDLREHIVDNPQLKIELTRGDLMDRDDEKLRNRISSAEAKAEKKQREERVDVIRLMPRKKLVSYAKSLGLTIDESGETRDIRKKVRVELARIAEDEKTYGTPEFAKRMISEGKWMKGSFDSEEYKQKERMVLETTISGKGAKIIIDSYDEEQPTEGLEYLYTLKYHQRGDNKGEPRTIDRAGTIFLASIREPYPEGHLTPEERERERIKEVVAKMNELLEEAEDILGEEIFNDINDKLGENDIEGLHKYLNEKYNTETNGGRKDIFEGLVEVLEEMNPSLKEIDMGYDDEENKPDTEGHEKIFYKKGRFQKEPYSYTNKHGEKIDSERWFMEFPQGHETVKAIVYFRGKQPQEGLEYDFKPHEFLDDGRVKYLKDSQRGTDGKVIKKYVLVDLIEQHPDGHEPASDDIGSTPAEEQEVSNEGIEYKVPEEAIEALKYARTDNVEEIDSLATKIKEAVDKNWMSVKLADRILNSMAKNLNDLEAHDVIDRKVRRERDPDDKTNHLDRIEDLLDLIFKEKSDSDEKAKPATEKPKTAPRKKAVVWKPPIERSDKEKTPQIILNEAIGRFAARHDIPSQQTTRIGNAVSYGYYNTAKRLLKGLEVAGRRSTERDPQVFESDLDEINGNLFELSSQGSTFDESVENEREKLISKTISSVEDFVENDRYGSREKILKVLGELSIGDTNTENVKKVFIEARRVQDPNNNDEAYIVISKRLDKLEELEGA